MQMDINIIVLQEPKKTYDFTKSSLHQFFFKLQSHLEVILDRRFFIVCILYNFVFPSLFLVVFNR